MHARSAQPEQDDGGNADRPPRFAIGPLRQAQVGATAAEQRASGAAIAATAAPVSPAVAATFAGAGPKDVFYAGRTARVSGWWQPGIARGISARGLAACALCRLGLVIVGRVAAGAWRAGFCVAVRSARFLAGLAAAGFVARAPWAFAVRHDRDSEKGARGRKASPRKAVMTSLIGRDRVKNSVSFPKFVC